jgi:hypothetical protein
MDEVRAANAARDDNFFASETMRYWHSRVLSPLHSGHFFVTSEMQREVGKRYYTIRYAHYDGDISTVGNLEGFMRYSSAREAHRVAARLATHWLTAEETGRGRDSASTAGEFADTATVLGTDPLHGNMGGSGGFHGNGFADRLTPMAPEDVCDQLNPEWNARDRFEAYASAIHCGWGHANFVEAYGGADFDDAAAHRGATDRYPAGATVGQRYAYVRGFLLGCEGFRADLWQNGTSREEG